MSLLHLSQEAPEETHRRLLGVLAAADFEVFEDTYSFEHIPGPTAASAEALAVVRDDEVWCQLVPAQHGEFTIFRFHFPRGVDDSGFVGWLATHLKSRFGTGVLVVCGCNPDRGGIFDYWGCPPSLGTQVIEEIRSLATNPGRVSCRNLSWP